VASPVTGDSAGYAASTSRRGRPVARRHRRSGSRRWLLLGRLQRAWGRQWLVFAGVAVAIAAAGVLAVTFGDADWLETLTFFGPAALLGGLGVSGLRELGRNTITSVSSLGRYRDYAVLGAAPVLTKRALRELPPDQRTPLGCLAFQPSSPFSTAFRDLQGALASEQIVAFISAFPREGASTAALCAAASATQQGKRVILLDCDLRTRTFTAALEHEPVAGVLEATVEPDKWRDFVDEEVETGLHFIPAARATSAWRGLAGAAGLPLMMDRLRDAYDLVILDCPPALTSADGPVVARMADKCVVVVAWDETPVSALRDTMRSLRARARTSTGIFVNRVPPGYRFGRLRPT
jgi:polysaccharide biosynthesis transport protein